MLRLRTDRHRAIEAPQKFVDDAKVWAQFICKRHDNGAQSDLECTAALFGTAAGDVTGDVVQFQLCVLDFQIFEQHQGEIVGDVEDTMWGGKRLAALPDLPTLKELGYNVEYTIWSGIFAPAGTPDAVMKTLRDGVRAMVADEEFKASMVKLETPINYLDAPEFKKFWDEDAKRLIEVVRKIGKIE